MTEHVIKVPDVGEGIAEAEIVELRVRVGDIIREDDVVASIMTDKATVEIPSPIDGEVTWLGGGVGEVVAIGAPFIKVAGATGARVHLNADDSIDSRVSDAVSPPRESGAPVREGGAERRSDLQAMHAAERNPADPGLPAAIPTASPYVRAYARERGIELSNLAGSGPAGRILVEDIERQLAGDTVPRHRRTQIERVKITGLRRKIASRLQSTKQRIPHFSYVEEVDVGELEALRAAANEQAGAGTPRLTVLPFIVKALAVALREFPRLNARFEDAEETLELHAGVHVGIATQTSGGLMVPVLRHAEALSVQDCALEISRLASAARSGKITPAELTGSTITVTSLGALGGIVTTPVINAPEVAIIGVNKIATRPVWQNNAFQPRKIMNLSSSFDHRIVDGWDAAAFIQRLRVLLEHPALMFMSQP